VGQISDLPAPVLGKFRGFMTIRGPQAHGDRLQTCGGLAIRLVGS